MNLTELKQHLESHGIKVATRSNGICDLNFSTQSTMSDIEAWNLVRQENLMAPPLELISVVEPNWGQFRIDMLNDEGYKTVVNQAITTTKGLLAVNRIESEIREQDTNLEILKSLWQELIGSILVKPTQTTINRWNGYCTASNMPFSFAANGSLTIT